MARSHYNGVPMWVWKGTPESTKPILTTSLTTTQRRMLAVLADGLPHKRKELHACLWDEMSELASIQRPISSLRKLLRPLGQDIVCVFHDRAIKYQHVVLLPAENPAITAEIG